MWEATRYILLCMAFMFVSGLRVDANCHMELRPTGVITGTYGSYDEDQTTDSLRASCEGNCDPNPCPALATTSDASGEYLYCPTCGGGEGDCCRAIIRIKPGPPIKYQVDTKGPCGGSCGGTDCELVEQGTTTVYWVAQCIN